MELGAEVRRKEFMYRADEVVINHGSFGGVPRRVFKARQRLQEELEHHPDDWYRRKAPRYQRQALEDICPFIGTKPRDTVFIENVTTGMDGVCRSFKWQGDGAIMVSTLSYGSVSVLAKELASIVKVQVKFPIESKQYLLDLYEWTLVNNPNIKLAVIAHITSPTSVIMPIKELATICHRHNVLVLVDGAHVPGQMPLNVEELGVDFYTGNIHKWLFTPRGCAFLWVHPRHQQLTRPSIVSHFHGVKLHFDFYWRGTRDDTAFMTVKDAIQFHKDLGGWEAITKYNRGLLDDAVRDLEQAWATTRIEIPRDMVAPFMRLVRLPDMANYSKSAKGAGKLDTALYSKHHIQALCICVQDELYVRLSAHVYNTARDYQRLRDAVLELSKEPREEEIDAGYDLPLMFWDLTALAKL